MGIVRWMPDFLLAEMGSQNAFACQHAADGGQRHSHV
jgi:hypothetical protein